MALLRSATAAALVLIVIAACSSDDDDGKDAAQTATTTPSIDLSSSSNGAAGSGVYSPPVNGCEPPADDSGCIGEAFEGENIPLDIYVMFDLSCSMSCSVDKQGCCRRDDPDPLEEWRIQPVRDAMRQFLQDPASKGIGVGLGFFGDHESSQDDDPQICSVENHADATVGIERLPDAAPGLITALEAGEPQGGTPTHLAIEGSCVYVNDWREQHLGHKVVILLVTDGVPEAACDANIDLATAAAADCYDDGRGFQTYVLGVVANNNNSLDQLNRIAAAGGTERAYLTDKSDIAGSVLEALNAIRADATIPCTLPIPQPRDGSPLDYNYVNLGICDAAGENLPTYYVPSAADCGAAGSWYYEETGNGRAIQLCEATCAAVSVAEAELYFSVGCKRVDGPPK